MTHPVRFARLAADARGSTIVEFAMVVPVLVTILMFLFDTGFYLYARSILSGEVQQAGRASSMESATAANQDILDNKVRTAVLTLVRNGTVTFDRTAYKSYARAQDRAEYIDANHSGTCDNGESWTDTNNNNTPDLDGGAAGQGGAKDVTIYTATLRYDRLFPIASLMGWNNRMSIAATTILRNQPFDKQAEIAAKTCTP